MLASLLYMEMLGWQDTDKGFANVKELSFTLSEQLEHRSVC